VEIVDGQVILVASKQELEKLERTKIPDDLAVDAKPVVAIIGAGAGKILRAPNEPLIVSLQLVSPVPICFDRMDFVVA
jgi:hypothetical protein